MSFTPAKPITSSQSGPHEHLSSIVDKHHKHVFRKPIADHTQRAFDKAYDYWLKRNQPSVILDSACGTAESSRYFAAASPDALVIGLDRSAHRLSNGLNSELSDNCLLLQCDCTDFWRLAEQHQWQFARHYLLYPNPYPKPQHVQRRWHGHPAFPSLLAISDYIELRTNWRTYAEEFALALSLANYRGELALSAYSDESPITAFERKYQNSEHDLWWVRAGTNVVASIERISD